jgi:flagellar basal-body rod protein FlgB
MARIDPTGDLLESVLDVATRRQSLVASNVANMDTPGYSTRDIDFQRALATAAGGSGELLQARTSPMHLGGGRSTSLARFEFEPGGLARRNDLNNVSVDREMLALSSTSGRYNTAIEILRKRFALLTYAILDGRGGG